MTTWNAGSGGHLVPFSNSPSHLLRWAHAYDPWTAFSCPDAPAEPEDTPCSHEASADQLKKTSWLPSGREDPNTSSTLQCKRATIEFRGVVKKASLATGTLIWAKDLLQFRFWPFTGCTGELLPPASSSRRITWSSRPFRPDADEHITDTKWRSRLPAKKNTAYPYPYLIAKCGTTHKLNKLHGRHTMAKAKAPLHALTVCGYMTQQTSISCTGSVSSLV